MVHLGLNFDGLSDPLLLKEVLELCHLLPQVLAIDVLALYDGLDSGNDGAEDDRSEKLDKCAVKSGEDSRCVHKEGWN